jgi:hypothetical protein
MLHLIHLAVQHVDEENAYLCGYLKIKNLTDEYPEMVTFFDGEIISEKHPFLTRKWDADEDVDRKHWVRIRMLWIRYGSYGSGSTILTESSDLWSRQSSMYIILTI